MFVRKLWSSIIHCFSSEHKQKSLFAIFFFIKYNVYVTEFVLDRVRKEECRESRTISYKERPHLAHLNSCFQLISSVLHHFKYWQYRSQHTCNEGCCSTLLFHDTWLNGLFVLHVRIARYSLFKIICCLRFITSHNNYPFFSIKFSSLFYPELQTQGWRTVSKVKLETHWQETSTYLNLFDMASLTVKETCASH